MIRSALFGLLLGVVFTSDATAGEPWDFERPLRDARERKVQITDTVGDTTNPVKRGMGSMLRFHRNVLSPVDGPKCPYYPTCSQYSREAIELYGPMWGMILTADRFMRETHDTLESGTYPLVFVGQWRPFDPPEHNWLWGEHFGGHHLKPMHMH